MNKSENKNLQQKSKVYIIYFYEETNKNEKVIEYFKKLQIKIESFDDFKDYTFNDYSYIIIYDSNIYFKKNFVLPSLHKNVLLITSPIVNTDIPIFDYYIPTSPELYEKYNSNTTTNVLLPLNIFNQSYPIKIFSNNQTIINNTEIFENCIRSEITDSDIVLFEKPEELYNEKLLKNKMIIKIEYNKISKYYGKIKSIINLYKKFIQFTNIKRYYFISSNKINIQIKNLDFKPNYVFKLKTRRQYLFIRNGKIQDFSLLKNIEYLYDYIIYGFDTVIFRVKNQSDYEFGILSNPKECKDLELKDFFSSYYFDNKIYYNHTDQLTNEENIYLYNIYGKTGSIQLCEYLTNYEYTYMDLIMIFVNKLNPIPDFKYNKTKFIKSFSFWAGFNNYEFDFEELNNFILSNNEIFYQKKILLISKDIINYGGNQKTSIQIYEELINLGYDVKIYCITDKRLVDSIELSDIINTDLSDINELIYSPDYDKIIVNKLNEIFKYLLSSNKKITFITHNSMDGVNKLIIKYNKYLEKVLTVNYEHINQFYSNNLIIPIQKYINYIDPLINLPIIRKNFKYNITFIGRLSTEKYVNMLIDSFKKFINISGFESINLFIIGDGNFVPVPHLNIHYLGKQNYESIIYYLINSDYLILPSITEGLPFTILEAQSFGIPVITSNIIGCKEFITNGFNGFKFNLNNYSKRKNTIDNFDIIKDAQITDNFNQNSYNLTQTLIDVYSISIEKWNELSKNSFNFFKSNVDITKSKKLNKEIIFDNNSFGIYTEQNCREIDILKNNTENIIKFNPKNKCELELNIQDLKNFIIKFDFIDKDKLVNKKLEIFIEKLNQIKLECFTKGISLISDKNNNWIKYNSTKYTNVLEIDNINDIL